MDVYKKRKLNQGGDVYKKNQIKIREGTFIKKRKFKLGRDVYKKEKFKLGRGRL